ncbi:MAG: GspMb/PilO family protein [Acidobacteria bacterium]|nr:GspMb/PilO family protein [Acidobacteriota bacterium]
MTLLRRVLAEKRLPVLIVAGTLAVDAALYALVVFPWSRALAAAEQRAVRAAGARDGARRGLAAAEAALAGTTEAAEAVEAFYLDVLPLDLADARARTSLRLAELAAQHGLVLEQRSMAPERDEASRLGRLRMTMRLEGEYRDLRRFVYALETGAEFIVIEEIVLRDGDRDDEAQVLTIGLATYYGAEGRAGSPGG